MQWCERSGKQIHPSKAQAGKVRSLSRHLGIDTYRCFYCRGWHLGHAPAKHWSRRKNKKEGKNSMQQVNLDNLVISSGVQDLSTILTTFTAAVNRKVLQFHEDVSSLAAIAQQEAAAVMQREPVLDLEG